MGKGISLFPVLQYRNLRLFLIGAFISLTGSYMQGVGVAWHVYQLTHSAFLLGTLGLVGLVPTVIGFLPAGIVIDTFHKKDILLISEALQVVFVFILFLLTQLHIINLLLLFVLISIIALLNSLETPARLAVVPLLVPRKHLSQALTLNTLFRQIGAVAGPALGGFFIALYGVQSIYLFNCLSYFLFFVCILFLAVPHVVDKTAITKEKIVEGLKFIRSNRLIATTILMDFFATFFAGAMVLLPIFAKDIYHVSAQQLGLLYAAPSLGAIFVGVYISSRTHIPHQGRFLLLSIVAYALATIGFGISKGFLFGFLFLVLVGASDMVSTVIRNVMQQHLIPDQLRGRVMSTVMVFFLGGPYLGDVEAGFVAGFFGAPFSVVIGGILTVFLIGAVALKVPALRTYEEKIILKQ